MQLFSIFAQVKSFNITIMKKSIYLFAAISISLSTISCNDNDGNFLPTTYDIQGKVEKGPFISGSEISIQPMNEKLQILGNMYSTSIIDDLGNFILGNKEFQAPYAEFIANGYFFNEVKGTLSNSTLTLRALVDLRNNTNKNVNIITHLKYARIKNLISQGKSFSEANKQAQKELLNEFGLGAYTENDAASFSIITGTDESAALIVISSLLLMDRSEAALTEYLSKLSSDFGKNGKFSDDIKTQIKADKENLTEHLTKIRENIISRYENLGIDVTVKDLSHFIDWNDDGIAGNEVLKENQTISLEKSSLEIPNEGGTYTIKINSPIPVYLEPQINKSLEITPSDRVEYESFFAGLYAEQTDSLFSDNNIQCQTKLADNVLEITISPLYSQKDKTKHFSLYDYVGNIVASIDITQKGVAHNTSAPPMPLLGETGKSQIASIAIQATQGLCKYNIIEQSYIHNKATNIHPDNNDINSSWNCLYKANSNLLSIKKADQDRLNVYGDYFNVFSALFYSNLVYGWGAVPYIKENNVEIDTKITRESPETIFNDLKNNLSKSIKNLSEKKNESMKDINSFFFVSKDVARVLLANILMYENNYREALPLLQNVIDNGFYALDESTDFKANETYGSTSFEESTEIIFALINENQTHVDITINTPGIIPYITLSDVYLSLAECHYRLGDSESAEQCIDKVVKAKKLTIPASDVITRIKDIREHILLHSCTYFAFLKRAGIVKEVCQIEDYQQLFPIPYDELHFSPGMEQNPGY